RSIPQIGHLPGSFWRICGCIEHVHTCDAPVTWCAPSAGEASCVAPSAPAPRRPIHTPTQSAIATSSTQSIPVRVRSATSHSVRLLTSRLQDVDSLYLSARQLFEPRPRHGVLGARLLELRADL